MADEEAKTFYARSNMPEKQGAPVEPTPPRESSPVGVNPGSKDCVSYPSMRGTEMFEFPVYRQEQNTSPFKIESGQLQHLPSLISSRVEQALTQAGDEEAVSILGHYSGCLRGAGIVDERTGAELDELTQEFAKSPDKPGFFVENVIPFLDALRPAKRG